MVAETCGLHSSADTDGRFYGSLADQILWLVFLRWVAVGLIVVGTLSGTYLFPVITSPKPLYVTAAVLLACNVGYAIAAANGRRGRRGSPVTQGTVQMEVDLLVLTAITLFGLLAADELNGGTILGHYPLQLSAGGGLWRNPVYGLAAFVAFAGTVMIAQYLTRMILARMASKELEAARNSDLLRAIINAMAEGLIFVTTDGQVALCNPAARRWRQDGRGSTGALAEGFPAIMAEHIKVLGSAAWGSPQQEKTIQFRTDGPSQRFIEARSCAVTGLDGSPLGHVIVGQDLTDHKKLEAELLARTEQVTTINETLKMSQVRMAQREKMVALGQMAAGIAHEIGNPLTSLSSVMQYLSRKSTDPEIKELCAVVDHHVGRISAILRRMLDQARPATSEYKWADVNELIENTLSLIRFDPRAQGITIVNVPNAELPRVWLSPQNLEQCLLNIVLNALDAMQAKGVGHEHRLELTRTSSNELVEIRIRDTGVGMSQEVCRRAFESFFTTKEISRGTGLGLFVSYNLITEVDGTIELESEPGKGTTAIIRIPLRPRKDLIGPSRPENTGGAN